MTSFPGCAIGVGILDQVLIAARSPRGGRVDTTQMLVWLLIAGVVIGVISAILAAATRIAHRRRYNSHPALFNCLSKVHGLNAASRRLMRKVVRQHRLTQPARLFIEPKWLDPVNLRGWPQPQAVELAKLRSRLFNVCSQATGDK